MLFLVPFPMILSRLSLLLCSMLLPSMNLLCQFHTHPVQHLVKSFQGNALLLVCRLLHPYAISKKRQAAISLSEKLLSQTNSSMTDLSISSIRHLTYYISCVPIEVQTSNYRIARWLSKGSSSNYRLLDTLHDILHIIIGDIRSCGQTHTDLEQCF